MLSALAAAAMVRLAPAEESDSQRAARVQAMTPEEKERLLQRKERFEALSPAEQERLRKLHKSIAAAPNSRDLLTVLDRYHQWLKSISSAQQAELMSLPIDQRIEKIAEIRRDQIQKHFDQLAWQLEREHLDVINAWMEDFVQRHEAEILTRVHPGFAVAIVSATDPKRRRDMLVGAVFGIRRPPGMPEPTDEDLAALAAQLPPTLQDELASQPTGELRRGLLTTCVRFAHFMRHAPPPPTDEELSKFYASQSAETRQRLDRMGRQEMKRELIRLYFWRGPDGRGRRGDGSSRRGESSERRSEGTGSPKDRQPGDDAQAKPSSDTSAPAESKPAAD
jgi:hypothetical protein